MRHESSLRFCWHLTMLAFFSWLAVLPAESAAQVSSGQVKQTIRRGMQYFEQQADSLSGPLRDLAAYAYLVAGGSKQTEFVRAAIQDVLRKIQDGKYTPTQHHIYEAGVDMMLLEEYDKEKFKPQMEAIARYLVSMQAPEGYWEYPDRHVGGDTSITQYGALGLWSAARCGIHVPLRVWEGVARWLMRTQLDGGAFAYWPVGSAKERPRREPRHSTTAAGVGALLIARIYISGGQEWTAGKKRKRKEGILGVLEAGGEEESATEEKPVDVLADSEDYVLKLKPEQLDPAINRGLAWLAANFNLEAPVGEPFYYMYAMERVGALAHTTHFGVHDWYAEGAAHLVKTQKNDGSWHAGWHPSIGPAADTAFALLFLSKSTAKHVRQVAPEGFGGGLLSGARGLPDDLSQAQLRDGAIVAKTVTTPLDKLLADLANPDIYDVTEAQQQIVQQVQLGNREELIGQKELLAKLAKDPRIEVRRTAMWALGRCEDLRLAPILIKGLQDPEFSVAVEAYNALCTLSRRPQGLGPPPPAWQGDQPPDAAAIEKWRREAVQAWTKWYLEVRPYDERDDPLGLSLP